MKYFFPLFFALLFTCLGSIAQQNRFVYLQTDNKQPFYVKLGKVVYSSSAAGYLIIPKLTDNKYELHIGFPKNEFPEQQVNLEVSGKDAGYLLKNFGEKGWGLFNLQSMAVVMASGQAKQNPTGKEVQKSDNEFSRVLADVVNSPDIAQEKKSAPKEPEKEKPVVQTKATEPQKSLPPNTSLEPAIRKLLDEPRDSGRHMLYVDQGDTISVFFPMARTEVKKNEPKKEGEEKKSDKEEVKKQGESPKKDTGKVESTTVQAPLPGNCTKLASEDDFAKLRKKMASRTNDFDMISDAMKSYKTRCYRTEQVRNLSALFVSNQGKYSFFDASYNYVSDPGQYIALREMLTDDYFRARFDAMIRK